MDTDYSKREIDRMFGEIRDSFSSQNVVLNEIKTQVKTTNGRVSSLERWKFVVIGFCSCVTIILLPLVFALIQVGKI